MDPDKKHDEVDQDVMNGHIPVILIDDQSSISSLEGAESPPMFGEQFGRVAIDNETLKTKANITEDGRINIAFAEKSRRLSILAPLLDEKELDLDIETLAGLDREHYDEPPPMKIVIQIIGSRGDIQPFIALGKELKKYGHLVRVATHPTFKDFVTENGLEFYSVGGDPAELMSYMVRNPGLIPGLESIRAGDIGARRRNMYEMMVGFWFSCISPIEGTTEPFLADAIIANPPSYAHIHCAEKLGIPLHLMFTMPWSPTHEFPHPLANVNSTNLEPNTTNLMTYPMVDLLTWQGLGDVVNKFRRHILRIEELSPIWAPSLVQRAKIPYTYCWSPALIPKPKDWGAHIDISGFFFLDLATNFTPPDDLAAFLAAGPPPVYIGFGSIVVKDPAALTALIFEAVKILGIRALVSEGWGGLGAGTSVPENIFMLGNCPHDWLFKRVSAVVHHGGAGTTAIGLRLGRPTVIVPFFGDQAFWARMVNAAGAGPEPQPFKTLTAEKLAQAIKVALSPEATTKAAALARAMDKEEGAPTAAKSFHRMLPLRKMRCAIFPKKLAVWKVRRTNIVISSYVAIVLLEHKALKARDIKPCTYWELDVNDGPFEPLTGTAGSLIASMGSIAVGFGTMLAAPSKALYGIAVRGYKATDGDTIKGIETETSSIVSDKSGDVVPVESPSSSTTGGSKARKSFLQGIGMKRTQSDQSSSTISHASRAESMEYRDFKENVGAKGLGRVLKASIEAPVDFSVAMAQGWHNLPNLYGQKVRHVDPVKDFTTGARTAAKQFGLGFYDGITNIFFNPVIGAQKEGGIGFLKGLGTGALDLFVRSSAGLWALPAYTLKGVQMSHRNQRYKHEFNGIFGKRFVVGMQEYDKSTHEDRQEVLRIWHDNGFQSRLNQRGELSKGSFVCPMNACDVEGPHKHYVDGDADLHKNIRGFLGEHHYVK